MKKTIFLQDKKRVRRAVYCTKCCNKTDAMNYIGDYAYADVPCKCKLSGWKKELKERFK